MTENQVLNDFIKSLKETNTLLSDKDKKKYEKMTLVLTYESPEVNKAFENPNIEKFSYEKLTMQIKATFKRAVIENKFCEVLGLDYDKLNPQIRANDLFRAYNFTLSEWVKSNKELFI